MKKKAKYIHIPGSEWSNDPYGSLTDKMKVWANKNKLDKYQKKIKVYK